MDLKPLLGPLSCPPARCWLLGPCADLRHVPAAVSLYEQLGVKKAPLGLIPPAFETPLPPWQPATFPPVPREPPPPALELFDLDEAFAEEQASLVPLAVSNMPRLMGRLSCRQPVIPNPSCRFAAGSHSW